MTNLPPIGSGTPYLQTTPSSNSSFLSAGGFSVNLESLQLNRAQTALEQTGVERRILIARQQYTLAQISVGLTNMPIDARRRVQSQSLELGLIQELLNNVQRRIEIDKKATSESLSSHNSSLSLSLMPAIQANVSSSSVMPTEESLAMLPCSHPLMTDSSMPTYDPTPIYAFTTSTPMLATGDEHTVHSHSLPHNSNVLSPMPSMQSMSSTSSALHMDDFRMLPYTDSSLLSVTPTMPTNNLVPTHHFVPGASTLAISDDHLDQMLRQLQQPHAPITVTASESISSTSSASTITPSLHQAPTVSRRRSLQPSTFELTTTPDRLIGINFMILRGLHTDLANAMEKLPEYVMIISQARVDLLAGTTPIMIRKKNATNGSIAGFGEFQLSDLQLSNRRLEFVIPDLISINPAQFKENFSTIPEHIFPRQTFSYLNLFLDKLRAMKETGEAPKRRKQSDVSSATSNPSSPSIQPLSSSSTTPLSSSSSLSNPTTPFSLSDAPTSNSINFPNIVEDMPAFTGMATPSNASDATQPPSTSISIGFPNLAAEMPDFAKIYSLQDEEGFMHAIQTTANTFPTATPSNSWGSDFSHPPSSFSIPTYFDFDQTPSQATSSATASSSLGSDSSQSPSSISIPSYSDFDQTPLPPLFNLPNKKGKQ